MNPFEVKKALSSAVLLVDTREQDTSALRKRLDIIGLPYVRQALTFGDYSIKTTLDNGTEFDMSGSVAIERKMSLTEICGNFCKGRGRFTREFERAKQADGKMYLLVENATWEKVLNGKYRSKMASQALTASLLAWCARYKCIPVFCKAESAGRLIREILYRELKERLESEGGDK